MSDDNNTPTTTAVLLYFSICIFRVANALLIQTQFDPDEYWQTLEPAYCEAFPERSCAYTWEWTRRATDEAAWWMLTFEGPIRSYLSVLPTYMFYFVAKRLQWDKLYDWIVPRGPVLLHAVLVAAPTDLATWYMAQWVGSSSSTNTNESKGRYLLSYYTLFCSIASWFNGYALIRTNSNSVETMLLAVSIALVSPELFGNISRPKLAVRTATAFLLGGMSVAVRFTSLAAFVPVGVLLALQKPTLVERIKFLIIPCAFYGLVGIAVSLIVDRIFYGFWAVPFLGSLHFNVILGLGSLYGTHAFHWYLSSAIPAITGILLPFILYDAWKLWSGDSSSSSSLAQRNTWIIIVSYTILHSFSSHKEFRFLLPILPLFCIRAGHVLYNKMPGTRLGRLLVLGIFILPNLVAVLYLGTFHQGAPIQVNRQIRQLSSSSAHDRAKEQHRASVHYLMGCHSTPLFSHLHVPSVLVDAWTLDCSPDCRSSQDVDCESTLFEKDPVAFVDNAYSLSETETCASSDKGQEYCVVEAKQIPDFLVVYSAEAFVLTRRFDRMGLQQVDRFAHGINGLRVGPFHFGDDFEKDWFRHVNLLGFIELSLDDMVLFAKPGITIQQEER